MKINTDKIWKEGKYIDWWSLVHFLNGMLLSGIFAFTGLNFYLRIAIFIGVAIIWEIIEPGETVANKMTDVFFGTAGFFTYLSIASVKSFLVIACLSIILNYIAWIPSKKYKKIFKI